MDRLLNAGASLHAVNQDCNTALHLASYNNHLGAISLLLKWGAKTDMRNAEGLVPVGALPCLLGALPAGRNSSRIPRGCRSSSLKVFGTQLSVHNFPRLGLSLTRLGNVGASFRTSPSAEI